MINEEAIFAAAAAGELGLGLVARHESSNSMNLEALAKKVGYVGIFSRTVEDASANLHRLMTSQICGFDEGVETWRESLSLLMQSDLRLLNWAGATFTEHEWRLILENVRSRL